MPLIHSISGLRATLGDSLTPQNIITYVLAFHKFCKTGKIIIGRDGRPSGKWIEHLLAGTLAACGREVELIGIVPTPTVLLMIEKSDAAGGIAITASHNPEKWNGLKFLNSDGIFLDKEEHREFARHLEEGEHQFSEVITEPKIHYNDSAIDRHIDEILKIPFFNDELLEKIRRSRITAAVDAVNASGSIAVSKLLKKLNVNTVDLFCDNSGIFPHTPEPLPENLKQLSDYLKNNQSDIGIAVDPDADRLVIIDENGEAIGEEKTIVMAVRAALEFKEHFNSYDDIATVNLSTTRLVEDMAERFGAKVERSAVGEINVVKRMKENNSLIGGEGSGGVILPACHYGRDSLVGVSLILALMAKTGMTISQLAKDMPEYKMIKTKKEFTGELTETIAKFKSAFPDFEANTEDGLRLAKGNKWLHLRTSNTEPIVRLIAEAATAQEAEELIEKAKGLL